MTAAVAAPVGSSRWVSATPTQMLSSSEPRKTPGSAEAPAMNTAPTAMPAGRKTAVAYPGGTASRRPARPMRT